MNSTNKDRKYRLVISPTNSRSSHLPNETLEDINPVDKLNIIGTVYNVINMKDIEKIKSLRFLKNIFRQGSINSSRGSWGNNYKSKDTNKLPDTSMEDVDLDPSSIDQPNQGPRELFKNIFFKIRDSSGKTYLCASREHFPVRKDDVVFGPAKLIEVQSSDEPLSGGYYYEFVNRPLGLVGVTQKAFFNNLASFSYGKIIGKSAQKIYYQLVEQAVDRLERTSENRVDDNNPDGFKLTTDKEKQSKSMTEEELAIDQLSFMSESFRLYPTSSLDQLIGNLGGFMVKRLLNRWYWYFLQRRCELLGLSREAVREMNDFGYSMRRIYQLSMTDAFTILPLEINEAISLKRLLGQNYTNSDILVATIARKIYKLVSNSGWSAAPDTMASGHLEELITKYGFIHNLKSLYFPKYYSDEVTVAERIRLLSALQPVNSFRIDSENIHPGNLEINLDSSGSIKLTDEQEEAVIGALDSPISVITGPAGTGKTTIIQQMADNLDHRNIDYAIVAYTGKAVCRIEEGVRSSVKPMTIHRLCYGGWKKKNPFKHLIIDEASMLTVPLLAMIFDKYPHDFALTLVGDVNQLPPIEWGFVLDQILKSDLFPIYFLTQNLRVEGNGEGIDGISANCNQIVHIMDARKNGYQIPSVYNFIIQPNFRLVVGGQGEIKTILKELTDKGVNSQNIAIITPFNRHISTLNNLSQEHFILDKRHSISCVGHTYYKEDIVMMRKNDYTINIMNGTTGKIMTFHRESDISRSSRNRWGRWSNGSGYIQILFITGKMRRFFINQNDSRIFNWACGVASNLSTVTSTEKPSQEFGQTGSDILSLLSRVQEERQNGTDIYSLLSRVQRKPSKDSPTLEKGNPGNPGEGLKNVSGKATGEAHRETQTGEVTGEVTGDELMPTNEPKTTKLEIPRGISPQADLLLNNKSEERKATWKSQKVCNMYPPNSEEEWQAIIKVIQSVEYYYEKYPKSPMNFIHSGEFQNQMIQQLFHPLLRIKYSYGWAGNLTLGYAMTAHKAEGSEWHHIISYLGPNDRASDFLNDKLMYTIISRGQRSVHCVGNPYLYKSSVLQPMKEKYDKLGDRLKQTFNQS